MGHDGTGRQSIWTLMRERLNSVAWGHPADRSVTKALRPEELVVDASEVTNTESAPVGET